MVALLFEPFDEFSEVIAKISIAGLALVGGVVVALAAVG